jgi:hypothetical protein
MHAEEAPFEEAERVKEPEIFSSICSSEPPSKRGMIKKNRSPKKNYQTDKSRIEEEDEDSQPSVQQ